MFRISQKCRNIAKIRDKISHFSLVNGIKNVIISSHNFQTHFAFIAKTKKTQLWWWPNDIQGPWGPKASRHLSYRWGKTPKKPHPGNLSWPGIEPGPAAWQACMLVPCPQRWTLIFFFLTLTNYCYVMICLAFHC